MAPATPWRLRPLPARGRVGLGTLVTVAATTAAADVTGILLASVIGAVAFFIIPARRNQAKQQMRRKIADVRERLATALRQQFRQEIQRSAQHIREGVAPYSRFIRAEKESLEETSTTLARLATDLEGLRQRIGESAAVGPRKDADNAESRNF